MKKQLTNNAAAAKLIRNELKKNNIKASVTSKAYSMGSSVNVRILQDITPAGLEEITRFANQFQYGSFDGMQDLYEYTNSRSDIPQVKYVFVEVEYSDSIKKAAKDYIANISGIEEYEQDTYSWMALSGSWGDFWSSMKPRLRVSAQ